MPYIPRKTHKRRRLRIKAVAVLCLFIVVLAGGILFSVTRFLTDRSGIHAVASTSDSSASTASKSEKPPSASTADTSSSAVRPVRVSLQDAGKPLWIHVSIEDQTLTVYDANNRVIESWLCSTGSPGYDTPKGTFSVYRRGKSFYSEKYQEGAYYYVAFYEDYYIHSVPFDKDKNIIPTIANDLGHKDSHGCVHLSVENSKWVYDNIPNGTKIVVD